MRDPVVLQLTQGITPKKIALTIAVGSALALFPILGTTTVLCLAAAFVLRLNQPIIHLINQALWPVHLFVIYGCTRLGERLFGVTPVEFSVAHVKELLWKSPGAFLQEFGSSAFVAVVAWALIAPGYIAAMYFLMLPLLRSIRRIQNVARTSADEDPVPPKPE